MHNLISRFGAWLDYYPPIAYCCYLGFNVFIAILSKAVLPVLEKGTSKQTFKCWGNIVRSMIS